MNEGGMAGAMGLPPSHALPVGTPSHTRRRLLLGKDRFAMTEIEETMMPSPISLSAMYLASRASQSGLERLKWRTPMV